MSVIGVIAPWTRSGRTLQSVDGQMFREQRPFAGVIFVGSFEAKKWVLLKSGICKVNGGLCRLLCSFSVPAEYVA